MKHIKKFENFYLSPDVDSDEQEFIDYSKKMREVRPNDDDDDDDSIESYLDLDSEEPKNFKDNIIESRKKR